MAVRSVTPDDTKRKGALVLLREVDMELERKLNLGCGPIKPHGWENVDGSLRSLIASRFNWFDRLMTGLKLWSPTEFDRQTKYANLLKRLPWSNDSVDCIYLGEVLEHFTQEDGLRLLNECFRIMKPGAVIRIRVPDNARFWRNYLQEYDANYEKPETERTDDHTRWVKMFFRDICVRRRWIGSFGHYHKWLYDEISLIQTLRRVGFVDAGRRTYLDSAIPNVEAVETREDLTVEARKSARSLPCMNSA
jgi:predicted SAM-dependent methyltransferase